MFDIEVVFRNPYLAMEAGVMIGMGIGCLVTVFFFTKGEDDDSEQ